jgi:hypothetical protein
MTRSQAALLIGWLAVVPGALFLSGNAGAIPAMPGQLIDNPEPPVDFQIAEQNTADGSSPGSAAELSNSEPPATPAAGMGNIPASVDALTGIPCLHGFSSDKPLNDDGKGTPCTDTSDLRQPFYLQFGRRLGVGSGILGETDGVRVDYRLGGGMTLQGVAGYPVVSSKDEFNTTRQMFGLSADSGTFAQAWNLNAYLVDEQDNAQLDNRTIGGTLRYLRPKRSILIFLDYDTNQDALNAITASGAWKLLGTTTLSATFDVHNNAIHKRQKTHLQHSMASTDGWNWILPEDRIKHYTSQRNREVTTRGFSLSHAFSQQFKLSGDVAMLDISEPGLPGSTTPSAALPSEYFYHLKLTGKDFLMPGNSNKLDLRHRVTGSSRISTASLDTRYEINRLWNVSPRLRTEHRNNTIEKSDAWVASPAVKMEYRWKKAYEFQFEAGGKWSNQIDSSTDTGNSSYFLSLGYQAKF